jgi:O-antigen/teichoic acid export membrane protein
MIRAIGQRGYGIFSLSIALSGSLSLLGLGLNSSYLWVYKKEEAKGANLGVVNSSFFVVLCALALVAAIAATLLSGRAHALLEGEKTVQEMKAISSSVLVMGLSTAMAIPMSLFSAYATATNRFIDQRVISLVRIAVTPLACIGALRQGYGVLGLAVASLLSGIVCDIALVHRALSHWKMPFTPELLNRSKMRAIAAFCVYVMLAMIVDQINWTSGRIILAHTRGPEAVAVYGIATQIALVHVALAASFSAVYAPRIHELVALPDYIERVNDVMMRIGRLQFTVLGTIIGGFALFGKQFLAIWAGSEYVESHAVALVLMTAVTIPMVQGLGLELQRAMNRHKFRSLVLLSVGIINLFLIVPLAKRFGPIGVAFGTAASLLIGNGLLMNWYYSRMGLSVIRFWLSLSKMAPALIVALFAGRILCHVLLPMTPITLFSAMIGYVSISGVSYWFLALSKTEQSALRGMYMEHRMQSRKRS